MLDLLHKDKTMTVQYMKADTLQMVYLFLKAWGK